MERYTIYCTEEQTKKALELGAPIEPQTSSTPIDTICAFCDDGLYIIPTAEQMIGWLSEKMGITTFHINYYPVRELYGYLIISKEGVFEASLDQALKTHKEATLAAIDAALDYLSKNKE